MKGRLFISGFFASLVLVGYTGGASADPPPADVHITGIGYRGPACPPGTADVDILEGGTSFLVTYSAFQAQAGPGIPLTEASKTCTLTINLAYPPGFTWTVASIAYRGNAILADRVSARLRLRYSFPGLPSVSQEASMTGAFLGDFELLKELNQFAWAPCDGRNIPMTINATGQVDNSAARGRSGILTVEQTDGTFKVILNLQWQRCS